MSRLTLITYRLASRLRSTPQSLPSRLFAQQAAVRTARATPSQAWFERVARAPSAHRQSSRWRPLGAAASNAHAAHMPHAEAEATGEAAASGASSSSSSSSSDARMRLLISYHDLERALERRGVNKARAALAAFAGLVVAVGLMWPRIKQWGAVEGAEVAAASLEHEQLQTKAMAMVREVLTDPRTALQVEALLNVAVTNLLNDAEFTEWAVDWTARVLSDALMRDALVQYGTQYVVNVLSHDDCLQDVQRFLSNAVNRAVDDETLQDKVASVSFQMRDFSPFFPF